MMIGLAGVTSTGKTTMANAIKERYGNRVVVQEKISRREIFKFRYAKDGYILNSEDLRKLTNKERAMFDISRVELQMKKESDLLEKFRLHDPIPIIIDGCTLVKIAYLIYLSAPFIVEYFGEDMLTEIVEEGLAHCNKYYSSIFYLPVTRLPFKEADHRVFKNEYIRTGQDAILNRLMTTKIKPMMDIVSFNQIDMNLVFDELSKMGIQ